MSTAPTARNQITPIAVSAADLPLSCPLPGAVIWNMHPQVYLPIEATGKAACPYCGANYVLTR